ncbi:UDP-N-acetylmuramoyl-L-alanyl-D-glutamate--2,6-diaminopimelate ligase, partial [Oscillospiraceae bacterium OttesenSCG-928-F05]|nr:UDP-N-acetylmuramoyl-L-alanyl-D-glutamate--2,6-diaminopimelate ligase [Oscillospiraceae bacterium OttesenSCG-928-F05]
MTLKTLLEGVEVLSATADMDMEISDVTNDSRAVRPGALFAAVTGYRTDGHRYVRDAAAAGAAAAIVEKQPEGYTPHVVVCNSRKALSRISANFYGHPSRQMTVIGVTGTNGKTTVTYLIYHMLEKCLGATVGLIGTNEIIVAGKHREATRTTPESMEIQAIFREMRDAGTTHVVMEVSSHALKLHRVEDVDFDYGIFTNLTQDHLDFHDSMEDYRDSKGKLFRMCKKGIFNRDDPAAEALMAGALCPCETYGIESDTADTVAKNIKYFSDRVEFEALGKREIQHVRLHIPGKFSVYNALSVLRLGRAMDIPLHSIAEALRESGGVSGRCEVVPTSRDFTVIIDYAHTPDALENILTAVRGFTKGRVICVFGCGGDRDKLKRPLMGGISEALADLTVVTSDNPRTEDPGAIIDDILLGMGDGERAVIPDREEAIAYALQVAKPGDTVLLAGKGHETYQEIHGTKRHMDEREIVAEALKAFS